MSEWKWSNITFFALSPIVAVVGIIWRFQSGGIPIATWILTGVMLGATGIAVTAGYHRLFSHRTYQASWPVRLLYILIGSAALEGSVRWWCLEHRYHHRFVDTEKDPYGINKGFWYAHIGWLLTKEHDIEGYENIKDLEEDPLIRLQSRHYFLFAIVMGFLVPMGIASLWGDPWGGLLVAGLARIVLNHHLTFCINSFCHYIGRQPYSDKHSAKDSWIAAILTWGEGYHNFHHEFQGDYRNGVRFYHWDPAKWLINFFSWMGLARGLRRVSDRRILAAKLQMDEKNFLQKSKRLSQVIDGKVHELLISTREHLQQAYDRFLLLKEEYRRKPLLREEFQRSREEFRRALANWRALMNGFQVFPLHVES